MKHLFPVPKLDTKRIVMFANQSDYISFRLGQCILFCASSLLYNFLFKFYFLSLVRICFSFEIVSVTYRHHIYEKNGSPKSIELKEIGPRFELRLYQVCITIKLTINCFVISDVVKNGMIFQLEGNNYMLLKLRKKTTISFLLNTLWQLGFKILLTSA